MIVPMKHHILDAGVLFMVGMSFSHFIPPLAATLGAIWYAIEIWESATFERLRKRVNKFFGGQE